MYYYLYLKTPCAVKVDGEYLGISSLNLTYFEGENCFLELLPLDQSFCQTHVYLDNKLSNQRQNIKIIDLYGGLLIIPTFTKRYSSDFNMIGKKTFNFSKQVSVFCYNQAGVKLAISSNGDTYIESLPFLPEDIHFDFCSFNKKEYLVVICVGARSLILAFCVSDKITRVFKNLCDGYGFEGNKLFTLEKKSDVLQHTLSSTWEFADQVKLKSCSISSLKPPFSLPEKLIPYAFLEEVLIDGEIATFLSPSLKDKVNAVRSFLGDFKEVLPPPHFVDEEAITLLYQDKVEYVKFQLCSGLIDNLTLL